MFVFIEEEEKGLKEEVLEWSGMRGGVSAWLYDWVGRVGGGWPGQVGLIIQLNKP